MAQLEHGPPPPPPPWPEEGFPPPPPPPHFGEPAPPPLRRADLFEPAPHSPPAPHSQHCAAPLDASAPACSFGFAPTPGFTEGLVCALALGVTLIVASVFIYRGARTGPNTQAFCEI
ncbi:hypothetical protein T492DRAFT_878291 [Pavlovales sp. CCMP2436]|nr:hypothetical protein T492DRAFT_878291 [Pavlovales sp. CCMP2436]